MASMNEQLRGLYSPEQLRAMDKVSEAMLSDPTVLDNRKIPAETIEEKEDGR